jgi:hypothetical protein
MNTMTVAALTTIITTPVGARNVQKGPNSLNDSAPGAQRSRAHGPDLHPNVHLRFLFIVSFVELLLPLWLLIRG